MLNIKKVLAAKPKPHTGEALRALETEWGSELGAHSVPLPEHPRPQFAREGVWVLNGSWKCGFSDVGACEFPDLGPCPTWDDCTESILVPFSPEAPLSGVGRQLQPGEVLRYCHTFSFGEVPRGMRLLLHFDAVDYRCVVWCNGEQLGSHVGGYTPFEFDITACVRAGDNVLALAVEDPTNPLEQLVGKQRLSRGDIWYTAQSGIWKTVWLELVPEAHIVFAELTPQVESEMLVIDAHVAGEDMLLAQVFDAAGNQIGESNAMVSESATLGIAVPGAHRWSPDDPYLYTVYLSFGEDLVQSYCAFRSVAVKRDDAGVPRFFLNGEPFFLKGVLDQGYWPDGLLTAPSDEALVADIRSSRNLGFNMVRKHIKVESERWYYHCDRMGMLVWQDMVSGGGSDINKWQTSYRPTLLKASWHIIRDDTPAAQADLCAGSESFRAEWVRAMQDTIAQLKNHPSIVTWVLFNEGWGQFEARRATALAKSADPTRPIDAVSGWYDQRCGSYNSVHNYFRPLKVWRDKTSRAFVISEFGGLSFGVEGHMALPSEYGYGGFSGEDAWANAVRGLLARVEALEAKGLAGYVYTQLSDVEEETNGLLTYDRRYKAPIIIRQGLPAIGENAQEE